MVLQMNYETKIEHKKKCTSYARFQSQDRFWRKKTILFTEGCEKQFVEIKSRSIN